MSLLRYAVPGGSFTHPLFPVCLRKRLMRGRSPITDLGDDDLFKENGKPFLYPRHSRGLSIYNTNPPGKIPGGEFVTQIFTNYFFFLLSFSSLS